MKTEDPQPPRKVPQRVNQYLKYTSLGLQLVITIGIAGAGGYYLDSWVGWQFPVFLLSFVLIALAGSMYLLYKRISSDE